MGPVPACAGHPDWLVTQPAVAPSLCVCLRQHCVSSGADFPVGGNACCNGRTTCCNIIITISRNKEKACAAVHM